MCGPALMERAVQWAGGAVLRPSSQAQCVKYCRGVKLHRGLRLLSGGKTNLIFVNHRELPGGIDS